MKNPTGNKLEKLVFRIFDQMVEGADKYVTKQGSTWLIFTEDKRWVIEFTNDKTLWFNYNVFQSELDLINKDCTEERDLIKNWFESRFLNKPKVEETLSTAGKPLMVEDAIQEGVRHTKSLKIYRNTSEIVEDTIQNGVKRTFDIEFRNQLSVEDTIENGVKDTSIRFNHLIDEVEDTIENGVKETTPSGYLGSIEMKGKIVHQIESPKQNNEVEDTIQNGVKETKENRLIRTISVISTINNGVKEIIPLPVQDGNRDWGLYYQRQKNLTKPHTEYVKEVIEDPYNHRGRIEGVIRNTDKDGI